MRKPTVAVVAAVSLLLSAAGSGATAPRGAVAQGGTAAQGGAAINDARSVRAAIIACWNALGDTAPPLAQISVRLSFDRDGNLFGQPRVTYANPAPSSEPGWDALRAAVAQALARCVPLPLTASFRDVIAVHPIGVRLGNGWPGPRRLSPPAR